MFAESDCCIFYASASDQNKLALFEQGINVMCFKCLINLFAKTDEPKTGS